MYLTIDQFQIVERDVQNEGITFSHLEYDLLDHVCCDIEDRMSGGLSFDDAYNSVKSDIGIQGLRRVQEETLLLINKKYRMMKKSMKTLGTIALASMSVAAVAKLMHWPGAGILMILSFLVVGAVFFPAALYVWYKEVFNKERAFIVILTFFAGFIFMVGTLFKLMHWPGAGVLLSGGELLIILTIIIGGISYLLSKNRSKANSNGILVTGIIGLVMFLLGILFKIQHWPGAAVLLLLGSLLFFGIFLTIFIYNTYKEEKSIDTSYIFAVYAVSVVLIFTFLLAINISRNVFTEFVSTNAKLYNSISIIEGQINDTPESLSDLNEINIAANNLFNSIIDLKKDLIISASGIDAKTTPIKTDDLMYLRFSNLGENTFKLLEDTAISRKMNLIYKDIQEYKSLLLKDLEKGSPSALFIDQLLVLNQNNAHDWIKQYFYRFPLVISLNNLTQLQFEIRFAQQEITSLKSKAIAYTTDENNQK